MKVRSAVRNGFRPAALILLVPAIAFSLVPQGAAAAPMQPNPVVGTPLRDTATISGGFQPTGTLTFTIYGPNDPNCSGSGTVVGYPIPVAGNGSYAPS
jgi:hypothetical protein